MQLFDRFAENFLRGSVNQKAIVEHDAQWIVPDNEPDGVILIQNRKHKRTLDLLSHSFQAVEVEGIVFLQKLHRNVAIGFHARQRQIFVQTQFFVIPEDAVVHKREPAAVDMSKERMIILVELSVTLSRHARVPHDYVDVMRV